MKVERRIIDAVTVFKKNVYCSCHISSNMAENGHFWTSMLEYFKILTSLKNLDNGFVFKQLTL